MDASQNFSREEILAHLIDTEWLKELISRYLSQLLKEILGHYHYYGGGYCGPERPLGDTTKTIEHYPQKGIFLYCAKSQPAQSGTAFPSWAESSDIYLLKNGQFVTVESRSCEFCPSASSIYDADLSKDVKTEIRVWTSEEIEQEKEKLADTLLKLVEPSEIIA